MKALDKVAAFLGFERKADPLEIWAEMLRASVKSKAGQQVTLDNALRVATLFACLRVLSEGVAQVPFKLMQDTKGTKLPARDHLLYDLLTAKPNDWQTSFEFREQLVIHAAMGNAYAWKNSVRGRVVELILLDPGRMAPEQRDEFGQPSYKYTLRDGKVLMFAADQIWHIRGPSWNGYSGLPMLQIAREALGLAMATEESHAKLHEKGVRPSGTYTVDSNLNPTQYKQLKAWITAELAGADNVGVPMILDRGAKWLSVAMTGVDAQHLETRRYQIEEVCRFMRVSPIMVGYSDKATTYASAEQMFLAHVVHTLSPWYARIEQSADRNLLTDRERAQGLYFNFNANGLMRGAAKDRAEYYARALGSGGHPGWMTPDEVRALEDMNPRGGAADNLPPGTSASAPAPEPQPA